MIFQICYFDDFRVSGGNSRLYFVDNLKDSSSMIMLFLSYF